jgi:hypothetical protein
LLQYSGLFNTVHAPSLDMKPRPEDLKVLNLDAYLSIPILLVIHQGHRESL